MLVSVRVLGLNKRDMRYDRKDDPHNGLLHFRAATPLPGYWRYLPSADLASYIEHYWTIEWDLREPVLRETLPYPAAHIVLEPGVAQLAGVHTRKFRRVLRGKSRVLGAKFRAGGLRPFLARPVAALTDRVLELSAVFGNSALGLDRRALAHADHHAAIAVIESFLRAQCPREDTNAALAARIVERIAADRQLRTVDQLVAEFKLGTRSLQRLFSSYVGVSPKWVISRYRLQEAAERMATTDDPNWSETALELGYADQAHFIRDFRKLIGRSPAEYYKSLLTTAADAPASTCPIPPA